jgi:hypothetical protein
VNDAYPFVKKNVDFNSQARVSAIGAFSTASSEAPVAEDNGPQDESWLGVTQLRKREDFYLFGSVNF